MLVRKRRKVGQRGNRLLKTEVGAAFLRNATAGAVSAEAQIVASIREDKREDFIGRKKPIADLGLPEIEDRPRPTAQR